MKKRIKPLLDHIEKSKNVSQEQEVSKLVTEEEVSETRCTCTLINDKVSQRDLDNFLSENQDIIGKINVLDMYLVTPKPTNMAEIFVNILGKSVSIYQP